MPPTKAFVFLLFAVHGILALWALVGFVEWFVANPPWPRISNPLFPRDILLMQWALSLTAAVVFIGGWLAGWRHMPVALACTYAAMMALCIVQTVTWMDSSTRYLAATAEFVAYTTILVFLFRTGAPLYSTGLPSAG